MATPITPAILLQSTGRERGPDFMLKVEKPVFPANSVLTQNSNITEVLNVIAYLCNANNRTDALAIDAYGSVPTANHGAHTPATGQYVTANTGDGPSNNTLWTNDAGAATTQMVDLLTFQTPAVAYAANHIPVGILVRDPAPAPPALGNTYSVNNANNLIIAAKVGAIASTIEASVLPHLSGAVIQMINILEHTRKIFGPKGWTALFNQVKGGGAGSKHAKRTHRQHRRKYSSKHY